jgi:hypothetical protein
MQYANYIGLLLYAVDENENKVGSWDVPFEAPPRFWTPPDYLCGGKAVMHADASPKGFVHSFSFRGPAAGTGTIFIRALVKHGDTNQGSFYWPTAPASDGKKGSPRNGEQGGDLLLTEAGSTVTTQTWHKATGPLLAFHLLLLLRGTTHTTPGTHSSFVFFLFFSLLFSSSFSITGPGQSCDAVCAAVGGTCDLLALQAAAGSPQVVRAATAKHYAASKPAVAACGAAAPAITDTPEQWLFFHRLTTGDNTCPDSEEIGVPSCSAVPAEDMFKMRRLCPCTTTRRRLRAPEPPVPCLAPVRQKTSSSSPHGSSAEGVAGCPHFDASRRRLAEGSSAGTLSTTTSLFLTAAAALHLHGGANAAAFAGTALFLAAASILPRASAHNWMWNPTTRVTGVKASTTKPCRKKQTNIPDVHVNSGQEFEMEWSTGHGGPVNKGFHYVVIINAKDAEMLPYLTNDVITKYIEGAPTSARWTPTSYWEKRHLSWYSGGSKKQALSGSGGDVDNGGMHRNEGKSIDEDTVPIMTTDKNGNPVVQTRTGAPGNTDYITRSQAAVCRYNRARAASSPSSGSKCFEPQTGSGGTKAGVHQWKYPAEKNKDDLRVAYTSEQYPWIVSGHRFGAQGSMGVQADITRYKIDGEPGQYIAYWRWRGYTDCVDIAVLPTVAGQIVPHTSKGRYGQPGGTSAYARIDHALFAGGRMQKLDVSVILRKRSSLAQLLRGSAASSSHRFSPPLSLSLLTATFSSSVFQFEFILKKSSTLDNGKCSDDKNPNPLVYKTVNGKETMELPRGGRYRTCYVIPPPRRGAAKSPRNHLGETRNEAIAHCKNRCDMTPGCAGLNVAPLQAPKLSRFNVEGFCNISPDLECQGEGAVGFGANGGGSVGNRNIPYGISNCDASCFANEPAEIVAEAMVCYPVAMGGLTMDIEEDWTVIPNDPTNEVWYSSFFRKIKLREFDASYTPCMESVGTEDPICPSVNHAPGWKQGDGCISCDDMEYNNKKSTQLPVWNPVEPEDCSMYVCWSSQFSPSLFACARSFLCFPLSTRCEHKALAEEAAAEVVKEQEDAAAAAAAEGKAEEDKTLLAWLLGLAGFAAGVIALVALVLAIIVLVIIVRKRQTWIKNGRPPKAGSRRDSLGDEDSMSVVMGKVPKLPRKALDNSNPIRPAPAINIEALTGWEACVDDDGTPFWFNDLTGESTWDDPRGI